MRKKKLLILEPHDFSLHTKTLLSVYFDVEEIKQDIGLFDALANNVKDTDVLWVRLKYFISADVLSYFNQLKYIVSATTGLNHIDLEACAKQHIKIISLRGEIDFLKHIAATAEHTLNLMLSLFRQTVAAVMDVRDACWRRDLFKGHEIKDKTIGLIGFGRVAKKVARYLNAMDAQVLAYDPYLDKSEFIKEQVECCDLNTLVKRSDMVSLHASYHQGMPVLLDKNLLNQFKPGAYLINTARGELIDECSLLELLKNKHLAGAALDVLNQEQSISLLTHPLVLYAKQHAHLLITPHIGGCTYESLSLAEHFVAKKLIEQVCV